MRTLRKVIIVAVSILSIGYLGLAYLLSNRVLTSDSSMEKTIAEMPKYWGATFEEMMAPLPTPEDISITGFEGVQLKGVYFDHSATDKCLFILAHGWGRNWPDMLKYYPMVEACQCDLLMYDHRAHGDSEGEYPTGGIKEAEDLLMVTEWASNTKGFEYSKIAWLGSSWGAATSLIAGAAEANPAFIVGDAPYQDWYSAVFERAIEDYGSGIKAIAPMIMKIVNIRSGVNYKNASPLIKAKEIDEPVLLIHSKNDQSTNAEQSVNIAQHLNAKSEFHHTLWGNDHVDDVLNNPEEMKNLLMNFIEKNNFEAFMSVALKSDTVRTDSMKVGI